VQPVVVSVLPVLVALLLDAPALEVLDRLVLVALAPTGCA